MQKFGRQSPLRVLHVYAGNFYGGVENHLAALASERALCPQMDPEFALCFDDRLAKEIRASGAPLYDLGNVRLSRPWTSLRARARLREVLDRRHPDVVVCHAAWPYAVFSSTIRRAGACLVFARHDVGRPFDWMNVLAGRVRPAAIIANSQFTSKHAYPRFRETRTSVVHCIVRDISSAPRLPRDEVRARLRTTDGDRVVLQISRLQAGKGHRLLLDALTFLPRERPFKCWMLTEVQSPDQRALLAELREHSRKLGLEARVRFIEEGFSTRDLFGAADAFCQPNLHTESFGIVFVEALSFGLPVVTTTAAGGALEIVSPECGFAVEARPRAVAGALERLLFASAEERSRYTKAAISRAGSFTDTASRLEELREALDSARVSFHAQGRHS